MFIWWFSRKTVNLSVSPAIRAVMQAIVLNILVCLLLDGVYEPINSAFISGCLFIRIYYLRGTEMENMRLIYNYNVNDP